MSSVGTWLCRQCKNQVDGSIRCRNCGYVLMPPKQANKNKKGNKAVRNE